MKEKTGNRALSVRTWLTFLAVCGVAGAVMFQTFRIQTIQGSEWRSLADSLSVRYLHIEAERGNIYSEDGRLMATSLPFFEVRMDLGSPALKDEVFYKEVDSLALCIAQKFQEKSKQQIKSELIAAKKSKQRYYLIRKKVTYPELAEMKTWPLFRLGRYGGGLIVEQRNKRETPFRLLAHRTIGYVREDVQPVGIEGAFDADLSGIKGQRLMQKIAGNTWVPINDDNEISPRNGKDLITTIDINLQDVVENALLKAVSYHQADWGTAIVMEVKTGKIKAIANIGQSSNGHFWENYNYAIGRSTEPGSTFKLAAMIALLEDGYVDITDSIDLEKGVANFHDKQIRDSEEHSYNKVTLKRAFEISSNVGISQLVQQYYGHQPDRFISRLHDLQLNKPTGIELHGEPEPFINHPKDKRWSGVSIPFMSIGYEVQLTPLQVLSFYNAIANGGKLMKPYVVKEIQEYGKTREFISPQVINSRIVSEKTLKKVRTLLEGVVENGTAAHRKTPNYRYAGKTGTIKIEDKKQQNRKFYQSSFAGYFPAENPEYSCIVVVSHPKKGVYYGGYVALPVFREIADKLYSAHLDIHQPVNLAQKNNPKTPPFAKSGHTGDAIIIYKNLDIPIAGEIGTEWSGCLATDSAVFFQPRNTQNGLIPNVVGMALKDALYLLENSGLKVRAEGRGRVRNQSLSPGQRVEKGTQIIIELS